MKICNFFPGLFERFKNIPREYPIFEKPKTVFVFILSISDIFPLLVKRDADYEIRSDFLSINWISFVTLCSQNTVNKKILKTNQHTSDDIYSRR